ncbi:MAG: hypothetical protein D6797_06945 [Bdellovibrio sp.]|nr:MAG: hypothetical protein D6797_06945 [Bdellovibrio sp.]
MPPAGEREGDIVQKILVYSDSRTDVMSIRRVLEARLPYQVFTAIGSRNFNSLISSSNFHLLVLKKQIFEKDDLEFIMSLRMQGYAFPILALEEQLSVDEDQVWSNPSLGLYFLEEPYTEKALAGITRKLLISKRIPKQRFKRYLTNQPAMIETILDGGQHKSDMYNLSKGGIYCEFNGNPSLAAGDMLRVTVDLQDMKKQRTLNAKVVWVTRKGDCSGRMGAGMMFVSSKDVYKMMMDKA